MRTAQSWEKAEEILEPIAEEAKSYELILAAHAHIDMNWMWSFNETVSIVLATFRSILNIMDQYPEFCFSQSQASVYKIVEEYDPELMERIKARIAEGRGHLRACAGGHLRGRGRNSNHAKQDHGSALEHVALRRCCRSRSADRHGGF